MCTPDTSLGSAVQPPVRHQAPRFLLPEDPSPEELVQYWTLSARDQAEVRRCRGEANRRRFAVQLCTLRAYGRFLPEATSTPVTITNHLARQLDLPLVLFGDLPERLATETEQLQRIRAYLGWQPFDDAARTRLTHWLTQRATEDILPRDLVERAEHILQLWQMVLPARSTLDALVVSVTTHIQDALYTRIATSFFPALQQVLDELLEVSEGGAAFDALSAQRVPSRSESCRDAALY